MGLTPASPGGDSRRAAGLRAARSRAVRASRSRIAAPRGRTTSGSSSSATRCSTCCSPSASIANFPAATEGDLSRLRSRLVSEEPLAEIAQAMQLGELLLLGSGELKTGGFRRQSILADAFEALCGALYLDGGLEAVRATLGPMFEARIAALPEPRRSRTRRHAAGTPARPTGDRCRVYTVKRTSGEPHAQTFLVSLRGRARGSSKPKARVRAGVVPNRSPRRQRWPR